MLLDSYRPDLSFSSSLYSFFALFSLYQTMFELWQENIYIQCSFLFSFFENMNRNFFSEKNKINGKKLSDKYCSYLKSLHRRIIIFRDSKPFEVSRRLNDRREGKVACSRIISSQREEITPRCFLVTRKRATCHEARESPASYPRRFTRRRRRSCPRPVRSPRSAPAKNKPTSILFSLLSSPASFRSSSFFFLFFFQLVLKHRAYNTRNRLPFPAKQYTQRGKKCSVKLAARWDFVK